MVFHHDFESCTWCFIFFGPSSDVLLSCQCWAATPKRLFQPIMMQVRRDMLLGECNETKRNLSGSPCPGCQWNNLNQVDGNTIWLIVETSIPALMILQEVGRKDVIWVWLPLKIVNSKSQIIESKVLACWSSPLRLRAPVSPHLLCQKGVEPQTLKHHAWSAWIDASINFE